MAIDSNQSPQPGRGRPFLLRLVLALAAFGICAAAGVVGAIFSAGACPQFGSHPERAVMALGSLGLGTVGGLVAGIFLVRRGRRGRPS